MNLGIGRINKPSNQIQQKVCLKSSFLDLGVLSFVLQAESVPWIYMPKLLWVQVTASVFSFKTQLEEAAKIMT